MTPLHEKKLFLLDMDGTLYLGDQLFAGTLPFLEHLKKTGARPIYLTNNSSKGAESYVEKLHRLGIASVPEDFFTSVDAAIEYLAPCRNQKIYLFGTRSFFHQMQQSGFRVTDRLEDDIQILLCGFDTELTFQKLEDACILLGRGVRFVATNPDWVCPTEYGYVPDCGSVCEMLFRATGRRPEVIGKPQPDMALLAIAKAGMTPEDAVLIGDRLYTDISCGAAAGIDTILGLSGESTMQTLRESDVKPTYLMQDIRQVLTCLETEVIPHEAQL